VEVRISCVGSDPADGIESLSDWLHGERELSGRLRLAGPAPRENELGVLADVLVVAVGSGGTISVLAASLKAWLAQPHKPDFRIRVQGTDGQSVDIDAKRTDVTSVITLLREALDGQAAEE
jgi:Effector Associated Constant Component 1